MSVLEVIASLPCVASRKHADTILHELASKGYAITLYRQPVDPECSPAPEGHLGEINVPDVRARPDENDGA